MTFCGFIFVLLLAISTHLAGVLGDIKCSGVIDSDSYTGNRKCSWGWKYVNGTQHSVCIQIFDKENYDVALKTCEGRYGKILGDLQALEQCFDGSPPSDVGAIWEGTKKKKCPIWNVKGKDKRMRGCSNKRYFLCGQTPLVLPPSPSTTTPPPRPTTTTPITSTRTTASPPPPTTTTMPMTTTTTTTQPPTTTKITPMTTTMTMTKTTLVMTMEQDFSCPVPDSSKCSKGWLHVGRGLCLMLMNKPSDLRSQEVAKEECVKRNARLLEEEEITPLFRAMISCKDKLDIPIPVDLINIVESVWLQQGCKTIKLQGLQVDLNDNCRPQNVQHLVCAANVGETVPAIEDFDLLKFLSPPTVSADIPDLGIEIEIPPDVINSFFPGLFGKQKNDLDLAQPKGRSMTTSTTTSTTSPMTTSITTSITTPTTTSTTTSMTTLKTTTTEELCQDLENALCPDINWLYVGAGKCLRAYLMPLMKWEDAQKQCEGLNARLLTSEEPALIPQKCFKQVLKSNSIPPFFLSEWSVWLDKCKSARLSQPEIIDDKRNTSCSLQDTKYFLCAVDVSISASTTSEVNTLTPSGGSGESFQYPSSTKQEGIKYKPGDAFAQRTTSQPHTPKRVTDKDSTTTVSPIETWRPDAQSGSKEEGSGRLDNDNYNGEGEGESGPRGSDDTGRDLEDTSFPRNNEIDHGVTLEEDGSSVPWSGNQNIDSPNWNFREGNRHEELSSETSSGTSRNNAEGAQDTPQTGKDKEFAETASVLGIPVVVIPVVLVTIIAADIIAIAVYKNRDRLMRHFGLLPITDKRDLKNAEEGNVDADVNDTGSGEAKNEDEQSEGKSSYGIEEKKATNEAGAEKPGEEGEAAKSGDEDGQKASSDEKGEEKAGDGTEEKTDQDKKEEKTGEDKEEEKPGGEKGGESSDEKKEEKAGEDKGEEKPDGGKEDKSGDGKGEGKSGEEKEGEKSLDKQACEKSEGSNTEEKSGEKDAKAPDGEKEEEKTSAEKEKKKTSSESEGEKSDEGKGDNSEDSEEEDND